MATDFLGILLQELGPLIKVKDLEPDRNNSCLLKFPNGVEIQLEMTGNGDSLLIGSNLGQVPPGRYKIELFREALRANGMPEPRYGTLAFSKATNGMVLFEKMSVLEATADKVADFLPFFLDKAAKWKTSLERGEVPQISIAYTSAGRGGMFGLRP